MEHIKFTSLQITVAIVLSIIILTVAQILSFSISELPLNIGVTPAICNIFAGVLYCVFAFLGTKLLCQKLLKTSLLELKIPRFKVKAVWIGGILHIGNEADSSSIFNFILDNKSFLISGGDFGIEASIISILVYLLFIVLAAIQVKRKGTKSKIE